MTQYPNEKELPQDQGSRDGAAPSQFYPPPQGPPPDYGYTQSHPPDSSGFDPKGATHLYPPNTDPYAASTSGAGPSAQPGGSEATLSLGAFFGINGPPPMWRRQPPPPSAHVLYNAFPPMCLISNGGDLSGGFPELPPPCPLRPHPFATHDVTEEDWKRFLADVKKAGSLSPAQRIRSNVIPLVTGLGFLTGFIATMAIEKKIKYKNRQAAGDLVDHWNHYFFGPRRMEVVLCQASERLSGKLGVAPVGDPNQQRMANGLRQRGDDDASDDDASSEDDRQSGYGQGQGHGHGLHGDRHAARRERRGARRARRAERRERKARGEDRQPYQLFVTSI